MPAGFGNRSDPGGDNSRAEMDRGTVRAFDPKPAGKTDAANARAPMSVDTDRDMVSLPPGSVSGSPTGRMGSSCMGR